MDYNKEALRVHKLKKGKITLSLRDELDSKEKLSVYYTPGVAEVSRFTAKFPEKMREVTWTNNLVAVISDGSAVLGLGDIGPYGAMPVMEGKAMLFKHLAGVDAVPIILNVHTAKEIIEVVKAIAPSFGGINLEDISAPKCFEVENTLKSELDIPVMHDDQHGTAIVVLAGLINCMKIVKKDLSKCKITLVGAGAAGVAIANLLYLYAKPTIVAVDSKGIIDKTRKDLNEEKKLLLKYAPMDLQPGSLKDAVQDSDIFIGVSKAGLLTPEMVKTMAKDSIIFAMANPTPEILPEVAISAGAKIIATGRSDFPNQVNNALAFPGIFRGALDNKVNKITETHKINAAKAIAGLVKKPKVNEIIPSVFNKKLVSSVAKVIV